MSMINNRDRRRIKWDIHDRHCNILLLLTKLNMRVCGSVRLPLNPRWTGQDGSSWSNLSWIGSNRVTISDTAHKILTRTSLSYEMDVCSPMCDRIRIKGWTADFRHVKKSGRDSEECRRIWMDRLMRIWMWQSHFAEVDQSYTPTFSVTGSNWDRDESLLKLDHVCESFSLSTTSFRDKWHGGCFRYPIGQWSESLFTSILSFLTSIRPWLKFILLTHIWLFGHHIGPRSPFREIRHLIGDRPFWECFCRIGFIRQTDPRDKTGCVRFDTEHDAMQKANMQWFHSQLFSRKNCWSAVPPAVVETPNKDANRR
jgi:hypothetical protein